MPRTDTRVAAARPAAQPGTLPVIIYSDVICPWCYIGKRRLEAALGAPDMPADVAGSIAITWRPFELNPDMPEAGMERAAYRAAKFGAERSAELDRQMLATAREAGIAGFAPEKMTRTPNTRAAHRLIWAAEQQGGASAQNALVDALFAAYFEQGADIGRRDVLLDLAAQAGLNRRHAEASLADDISLEAVLDLEDAGISMGIRGVPFFVLAGKYAISGAQPAEVWRDALPRIAAEKIAAEAATA